MTIADLVAPPSRHQAPLKVLAHVEFQLRVLALLCAAAAEGPTTLTTPGSLDVWSRYIIRERGSLKCATCERTALTVAESIDAEVAPGTPIRSMRNQVFHGGPDPENVDFGALDRVVAANADRIVAVHDHGHVSRLEPFFITVKGELAALHGYSGVAATYWPRRHPATDVTDAGILEALQELVTQGSDQLLERYALDVEKDLRGLAEPGSIEISVEPSKPIRVRWELRASDRSHERVDSFELGIDHSRIWRSEAGPKSYKAFLADVCNWKLLKERLLKQLDEKIADQSEISEQLFPVLKNHGGDVPARVRFTAGPFEDGGESTIAEACERIAAQTGIYSAFTNLVVLTGEAGSGKTHSLLQFAHRSLSRGDDLDPIAIYVSSSGKSANSLDDLLDARLNSTKILDKNSVLALCRAGLAILVIDGFDELLGFRSYDNPLTGLRPILDQLRGRGTIILSARSSYSEARLRQSLDRHAALDWPPCVAPLELLPWRQEQVQLLTSQLAVEVNGMEESPHIRDLLTTPFFCLAYASWSRSAQGVGFLESVVDTYMQRERHKLEGENGVQLFGSEELANIFSEVAELTARNAVPEISEGDLELAAEMALDRELTPPEKRRLVGLCSMSAEWVEDDLSFRFTHLAIAEQFLARQISRLPLAQAVDLLISVPISALCAQLIVSIWQTDQQRKVADLISALQARLSAMEPYHKDCPGAVSLGELWAKAHGCGEGDRSVRRAVIDNLELSGSGRVSLDEASVENLVLGPGVELLLKSSRVTWLDLTSSSAAALIGQSYKQVFELLTRTELAVGPSRIKEALGLPVHSSDEIEEIHEFYKDYLLFARFPVVLSSRDFAPDKDARLNWVLAYGSDAWRGFVRKMLDEEKITLDKVNASGRQKVRLRLTEKFYD